MLPVCRTPVVRCTGGGIAREVEKWKAVADAFDPELYLRLAGERALLDPTPAQGRAPWASSLVETASALVAIGTLEQDLAGTIVEDYELALGMRGHSPLRPRMALHRRQPGSAPQSLRASRVVASEAVIERPEGRLHVHYVALSDRSSTVAISMDGGLGLSQPMRGPFAGAGLQLTDDQRQTAIAHFSGGGDRTGFHGRLVANQALSPTTKWIDVGTDRIELPDKSSTPPVTIEALADSDDPAERYLWGRLTAGRHGPHGGQRPPLIDVAIETLLDAGAIATDNPVLDEVRAVLAAFSGQPAAATLREPWKSLLAAPRRAGSQSAVVALGVVTPPIGGLVIAFDALVVTDGVFEVHVGTSPNVSQWNPMDPSLATATISWWAEDNLDNHYLGAVTRWGGGSDIGTGNVVYWPSLDPEATELRLTPTGARQRAVISVAIPQPEEHS
jgi:hypothetical protein